MSDSCDPKDCSLPGFSVCGILQARILEWGAITFSKGSSWSRNWTRVSCIAGRFFTDWKILYQPLMWCITWIDLYILDNPFISVINLIDYGVWSFLCLGRFSLLVFCWRFLHLCSSVILACNILFCDISVFLYQGDGGLI